MRDLNHNGMLSQDDRDNTAIAIIGTGAIGSFVAMMLAKMGFKNIVTWDHDKIEDHNIANQMFPVDQVGQRKANATRAMVKAFSGEDIITLSVKAEGSKVVKYLQETWPHHTFFVVFAVDSLDVRKAISEGIDKHPEFYANIIDARMGARTFKVLSYRTCDTNAGALYRSTLVPDSEAVQERCGQKSIIYTVAGVAAEVCNHLHAILNSDIGMSGYFRPNDVVFDYGTGMRFQQPVVAETVVF